MKYLTFDLEATRRERDDYRQKLEGSPILREVWTTAWGYQNAEELLQRALDLELLTERQFQEVWAIVGSVRRPMSSSLWRK